jgi:hypothetical protein
LFATDYREVLLSLLYPGAQTSLASLRPVVRELQRLLPLDGWQRQHTLLRIDAGFGDDANLAWLLPLGYQVLAKGYSGKRAAAYARRIKPSDWQEVQPGQRWLAWSPRQLAFGRPTRTVVVRWLTPQQRWKHALYVTTLQELELAEIADLYDERGKAEVEIQADKMGLLLARRRKRSFAAQEMLILLNDWAHNLLAWFHADALGQTPFDGFGPKRIIRDLFTIPAEAVVVTEQLVELRLKQSHPYAEDMARCLTKLWQLSHNSHLCQISRN